jgi:hypothetical protein
LSENDNSSREIGPLSGSKEEKKREEIFPTPLEQCPTLLQARERERERADLEPWRREWRSMVRRRIDSNRFEPLTAII